MEFTFDIAQVTSGTISLTDFPYTRGVVTILSPTGTTVYSNTNYEQPDFNAPTDVFEQPLPISNTDGLPIKGIYSVTITDSDDPNPSESYSPKLKAGSYSATIGAYQNCNTNTALVNYTSNIPSGATIFSSIWTITDPNGNIVTGTNPSYVIDPLIAGAYLIELNIQFAVTEIVGGYEVNTKYGVYATYTYRNTCVGAQTLICNKLFCCLKSAFYEFIRSPSTGNLYQMAAISAASVLVLMAIQCNKETEAYQIFDQLNTKYDCNSDCGCGCS